MPPKTFGHIWGHSGKMAYFDIGKFCIENLKSNAICYSNINNKREFQWISQSLNIAAHNKIQRK